MSMRWALRTAGLALGVAVVAASWGLGGQEPATRHPALIVHEWGVWVRGLTARGRQVVGGPAELVAGLPAFVLRLDRQYVPKRQDHSWDKPVLHFYGAEGLRVRVRVGTPLGRPVAYWPRPTLIEQTRAMSDGRRMMMYSLTDVVALEWSGVLGRAVPARLPAVPPGHWWERVRRVPSLYVRGRDGGERFLFYEATATREPTVTAELRADAMTLRNAHGRHSSAVLVIANDGQSRWAARLASVPAKGEATLARAGLSAKDGAEAALLALCRAQWTQAGLTEQEAEAIVATWQPDLLRTIGVLVISRMPRDVYDAMFPLAVHPTPKEVVRVGLVFDTLAGQPARERWLPGLSRTLDALGRHLGHAAHKTRAAARQRLARIGDLAKPYLERWAASDDPEVAVTARRLLKALEDDERLRRRWSSWKGKSAAPRVMSSGPERRVE